MFRRCRRFMFRFAAMLTLISLGVIIYFCSKQRPYTDSTDRSHSRKMQLKIATVAATTNHSSPTIQPRPTVAMITKQNTTAKTLPTPDMVNDYYPYVNFSIVFPAITPNLRKPQDLFLVVLVNSATQYHEKRDMIRETWASHDTCEHRTATNDVKLGKFMKWLLVFVVGKSSTAQENERNIEEAKKYNDMLIGNINDNYLNNVIKLYMGMLWAATLVPKYILKTDDDVYVRMPGVIEYLVDQNLPNRLYAGETYGVIAVSRNYKHKWAVSKKYYPKKYWPRFIPGGLLLMSTDLIGSIFNFLKERKPFHTDDTYIALVMQQLKVKLIHLPLFYIYPNMPFLVRKYDDCKVLALVGFAHNMDPKSLKFLHSRIETLCSTNFNKTSCRSKPNPKS